MKYTAAIVAFAAGAMASYPAPNATVVTEVVESYVTYCPGPTEITHGSLTYTVTEATTLTITDCPCTITKPVITSTATACTTCYTNATVPGVPSPTGAPPATTTDVAPSTVPTAAAFKAGLSGVAGAIGLAAFFL